MQKAAPFTSAPDSPARKAAQLLSRAAPTTTTILLRGERGVGKTRLAKWIHANSPVADRPFVAVHCPSIAPELLEPELFGNTQPNTTTQPGKIFEADGGTLFLDEIGDLSMTIQARLLRLIQERQYQPVGDHKIRSTKVRIVVATDRDLRSRVDRGEFLNELFHRLTVVAITVPALRERREMIAPLAKSMLAEIAAGRDHDSVELDEGALEFLSNRAWHGNLSELRDLLERALASGSDGYLSAAQLEQAAIRIGNEEKLSGERLSAGDPVTILQLETEHIRRVLKGSKSLTAAATMLGIDTSTLFRKRRRLGL